MLFFEPAIAIMLAYLIGSACSAIIVCKLMHLPDPRSSGSKNPGATNVLRIGGKLPAALTLLGDALKGAIPVFVAKWLGLEPIVVALVAFAAFFGHLYPVFFGFQGGKGVATFIGCLIILSWPVALLWFITWLIITVLFRYVSVASMSASLLAPIYAWFLTGQVIYVAALLVMGLLVVYRHSSNIVNLVNRTERKIGER